MKVTDIFKPSSENVKVLVLHSTEDNLGQNASNLLEWTLKNGVEIVGTHRITNLKSLVQALEETEPFNVLVFIAHGDKKTHQAFLCEDYTQEGNLLPLKNGELAAALKDHVDDKLCLFGVCYSGTEDLAESICRKACAMVCISPKPNEEISPKDIGLAYGDLLNKMQEQKHCAMDAQMLHKVLVQELNKQTSRSFSIFSVTDGRLC